jgi:2-dehydro-3-deoxyphosphogluconate aldolase/(4S)-4-hydroxy-2-oxoglutarate aldolase
MARFDRLTVLNAMLDTGLVPIFYHGDLAVSREVVQACARGGARLVEFTNRGDQAWNVFTDLIAGLSRADPSVILGAGTVLDAPTAAMYIASGANFVVGPNLNPEVARLCNRHKVAYIPGCGTVSEISDAEELGAEIVKIFPGGQLGGPGFVKAVLGPMPWTRLMPASGVDVTQENVQGWIKAGAACLGMGSNLVRKDYVAAGNYDAIADGVRRVLGWIREARGA